MTVEEIRDRIAQALDVPAAQVKVTLNPITGRIVISVPWEHDGLAPVEYRAAAAESR